MSLLARNKNIQILFFSFLKQFLYWYYNVKLFTHLNNVHEGKFRQKMDVLILLFDILSVELWIIQLLKYNDYNNSDFLNNDIDDIFVIIKI